MESFISAWQVSALEIRLSDNGSVTRGVCHIEDGALIRSYRDT